ncbi:MAG: hypothetical protein COA36_06300 [Desulfotalea sp.]|nr:MAG: hypothetical protein COA36_06300 [Desulfotalea sp.]
MYNQRRKNVVVTGLLFLLVFTGAGVNATEVADSTVATAPESGTWDKAGKEFSKVIDGIGDASEDSWESTKDSVSRSYEKAKIKSVETWSKTKVKSGELVDESVEASAEAADIVAEKSKDAWKKLKEGSADIMDKTKSKIHEMSGPAQQ